MFQENYAFYSSSQVICNYILRNFIILSVPKRIMISALVVELGCNDGILLENFSKKSSARRSRAI